MRTTQTCGHCSREISLHAWVCPHCGSWVGEIDREEMAYPISERAAA